MNTEQLLDTINTQCDALRADFASAAQTLRQLHAKLEQLLAQLHKNPQTPAREFAEQFNTFCLELRAKLDTHETFWANTRADVRACKPADWAEDLALPAKSFNSRAKNLSRACDEFTTAYDVFCRTYKKFTAAKLNVWLLTNCQTDGSNLTSKILFLARQIVSQTEKNRGHYAIGG